MAYNYDGIEHKLRLAARAGDVNQVNALLDEGADINAAPGRTDLTALVMAIRGESEEVVKLLLQRGAIINKSAWQEAPAKIFALFLRSGATLPPLSAYEREQLDKVLVKQILPEDAEEHTYALVKHAYALKLLEGWQSADPEMLGDDQIWEFYSTGSDEFEVMRGGYVIMHYGLPIKWYTFRKS